MFRGIGSGIGMRPRTKLILFAAALALVGTLYVFAQGPSTSTVDNCREKGIDPEEKKVGTCEDDGTKNVVVNPSEMLELETLDAQLRWMRERLAQIPAGTGAKGHDEVTFDLAVTNRTDAPETFGQGQILLEGARLYTPDVAAEKASGDALEFDPTPISPGKTVGGTVTFETSSKAARQLHVVGDLDIGNFGSDPTDSEPEAFFEAPEIGVIRTEKDR
jgi:hypothetical protein